MIVRDAAVWMRTLPLQVVTPVKAKRTSMTGWVTFTVRPTKALKLKKGGRVNIFVRASTPGQPIIGGTSTRRLVSLRKAAARQSTRHRAVPATAPQESRLDPRSRAARWTPPPPSEWSSFCRCGRC
jgi:hypothetical protein